MGFTQLQMYSESSLPKPGWIGEYTICEGASSYKPYDVSSLQSDVDAKFSALITQSDTDISSLSTGLDTLADDWGAKYISFDSSGIDIVRVDTFTPYLNDVKTEIESQQEKCNAVISSIISGTKEVETYLSKLEANNQAYAKAKSDLSTAQTNLSNAQRSLNEENNKEKPSTRRIIELNNDITKFDGQVQRLRELVSKYETSKIPEPEGQWVLG